jgi:hypothetical protein
MNKENRRSWIHLFGVIFGFVKFLTMNFDVFGKIVFYAENLPLAAHLIFG